MKTSRWLSLGLLSLFGLVVQAAADGVVVGTGNPALDVPAVQAAVDSGGTVTLVGLFNFGNDRMGYFYPGPIGEKPENSLYPGYDPFYKGKSTVFIAKSVSIQGKGATILGGRPAFWIGWDGDVLEAPPANGNYGRDWVPLSWGTDLFDSNFFNGADYTGPGKYRYFRVYRDIDVSIDGIESHDAHTFFVMAGAGHDIAYTNNRAYNCNQADYMVWPFGVGIASWNVALNAAGLLYPPNYYVQNLKTFQDALAKTEFLNAITGNLLVKDNTVENPTGPGGGIASAWTNAVVTIEGNTVTNAAPDGIHLSDNPLNAYVVKNNTVSATTYGFNIFDTFFPVRANLLNNTLEAPGPLRLKGNKGSVVKGNRLRSDGLPQIELFNSRELTVEGNSSLPDSNSNSGILLSGTSSSNTFHNIDFSRLTVTGAYVSCGTGTSQNAGTGILVPTCDPGIWLADQGLNNAFEFLAMPCLLDKLESCGLEPGIKNSLEAKLKRAMDLLDRTSNGSVTGAIGALNAFMSECRAQSGKKIPGEQAEDLIAYARKIRAVLLAGK